MAYMAHDSLYVSDNYLRYACLVTNRCIYVFLRIQLDYSVKNVSLVYNVIDEC